MGGDSDTLNSIRIAPYHKSWLPRTYLWSNVLLHMSKRIRIWFWKTHFKTQSLGFWKSQVPNSFRLLWKFPFTHSVIAIALGNWRTRQFTGSKSWVNPTSASQNKHIFQDVYKLLPKLLLKIGASFTVHNYSAQWSLSLLPSLSFTQHWTGSQLRLYLQYSESYSSICGSFFSRWPIERTWCAL